MRSQAGWNIPEYRCHMAEGKGGNGSATPYAIMGFTKREYEGKC